jgi:NAD(P)-binding Rossmann-like domain
MDTDSFGPRGKRSVGRARPPYSDERSRPFRRVLGGNGATVLAAGETQMRNQSKPKRAYDYIVIGSGASGAIVAGELSKTGADVLVVESGGEDAGPTISNPSIWFYNVGGPLDWALPVAPSLRVRM